jgi:hypothetical protein
MDGTCGNSTAFRPAHPEICKAAKTPREATVANLEESVVIAISAFARTPFFYFIAGYCPVR